MTQQNADQLHRYLFEQRHARGELVQLHATYARLLEGHDYPKSVAQLLGEALAATCLLTATLKFEGEITLQIQGDGPMSLLVINGRDNQTMRGIARVRVDVHQGFVRGKALSHEHGVQVLLPALAGIPRP